MDRGSDKHSARLDEAMAGETEGLIRSGHDTHAEEWASAEPSGEDQPDADRDPAEVTGRAELASYLGRAVYPANREQLVARAAEHSAPAGVLDQLRALPAGGSFENVSAVWAALGGQVEQERF